MENQVQQHLLKQNGQKSVLDSQESILLVVSREFPRFFAPKVIRLDDNERLLLFEFHIKYFLRPQLW